MSFDGIRKFTLLFLLIISSVVFSDELDDLLYEILDRKEIYPIYPKPLEINPKYELGQALFFDPILSGNRDVSCATCHLFERGTSDRLNTSIGVKGNGLAENRNLNIGELEHPRNALDLWNRDENTVKTLFWDGEFEVLDHKLRIFRSPLGDKLPTGFENLLAIQAVFPLVNSDEMLGRYGDYSHKDLANGHGNQFNELAINPKNLEDADYITRVHELIIERLLGRNKPNLNEWQIEYRDLFQAAFPDKNIQDFSIVDVGNSIAHFEELAFATRDAKWDKYLHGDNEAITSEAKRGALIFFRKGRCASCHKGPLMSDFNFHVLGVEQIGPGIKQTGIDLGRYGITGELEDLYKFRTPPLRNVTLTAPYFHDGLIATLKDAIKYHMQPNRRIKDDELKSRISPLLPKAIDLTDEDITLLIDFLDHLEDNQKHNRGFIIPKSVPSRLPIHMIQNAQN